MSRHLALAAALLVAGPVLAQDATFETPTGDAAAGEAEFRQCQTCHVVKDADGETLAGRNARTGPNLYGMIGNVWGYDPEFRRYSDLVQAANAQGLRHDTEAGLVAYLMDPTSHLEEITGESGRGAMAYRVRDETDAINLYAFLAQFAVEGATEVDGGS